LAEALGVARAITDEYRRTRALMALVPILPESERATVLEQILRTSRETGDRLSEATTLGNLGNAYASVGEMRRAIEHYEQALAIARESGDRHGEGTVLGNLGNALATMGDSRGASEHYERALAIVRETGDRGDEGGLLFNLSLVLHASGDHARAIQYAKAGLAMLEEMEQPQAGIVREQLARWRNQLG
jgi:tetratricopeptide (TPR) repeat protein